MDFVTKNTLNLKYVVTLLALLPAACGYSELRKPQLVAEPESVDIMLAEAADRATRSLEVLAQVEQTRTPVGGAAVIPNAPPELMKAVTFRWAGPAEPVARDLASKAGYTFQTIGDAPPAPVVVTLNVTNQPIVEVLRDLGLQLGTRADLRLDAQRRVVEIVYAPTANPTKG